MRWPWRSESSWWAPRLEKAHKQFMAACDTVELVCSQRDRLLKAVEEIPINNTTHAKVMVAKRVAQGVRAEMEGVRDE